MALEFQEMQRMQDSLSRELFVDKQLWEISYSVNDWEHANYTLSVAVHLCELGRITFPWTVPLTTFSKTLQNTIVVYHCFEGRTAGRRKTRRKMRSRKGCLYKDRARKQRWKELIKWVPDSSSLINNQERPHEFNKWTRRSWKTQVQNHKDTWINQSILFCHC